MSNEIGDVTIVGGGDSGLLCGLCIQQLNPSVDVAVVDDFQRDIPQVGKSTYRQIIEILHEFLDVDERRFLSEVRPVWKATVYFRDWCGESPFHFPFDLPVKFPGADTPNAAEVYYRYYDELYDSPDHRTKGEAIVDLGKSPWSYSPGGGGYDRYDYVAYHLDTSRFNTFLRDLCRERGVSLVDDDISGVDAAGGTVDRLHGENRTYESDLYVDATGFNRVIKRELDAEYVDFDLPLDSAFNARGDRDLADVVPATVVESGEYGWFWQIDTYDNRDLGYVYASEYVSDDEALAEFLDHCDDVAPDCEGGVDDSDGEGRIGDSGDERYVTADDVAKYTFTSGYYDPAWEGNCIAIGNAEGFVEPLQSTGLTANAQTAVKLSKLLSAHGHINDEGIRDTFNTYVRRNWESIYDFISVHYKYASGDNAFWEAMQAIDVSPRVELLVREFDRNGFGTDIDPTMNFDVEDLLVFRPIDFYVIMRSMGATSEFYESNEFQVSYAVEQEDRFYRNIQDEVAEFLTTEELYESAFDFD